MTRPKKALLTSVMSVIHIVVTMICGFILPRLFLTNYGSAVNGLVSSIAQFLGFISLAECGVGAVVRSTFYKPLARKDNVELSKIAISSDRFFRNIALILLIYTLSLAAIYPFVVAESFDFFYSASLILIISISSFTQYYFGMTYRILIGADQCGYIIYAINIGTLILNVIMCVLLVRCGADIHIVKLVSSIVFILQPLLFSFIGRKKYNIDKSIVLTEEPIKQKWNGLAQHIASVVLGNTDIVVLTFFSTLEQVSIYSVYHLVVNGVKQIVDSATSGTQALFGNMLANEEYDTLLRYFNTFESIMHFITTFSFGMTSILIVPFISVYTKGVTDANYIVPLFAYLITAAQGWYCLRLPYSILVLSAGHFKETQTSAIIEASINIVISVIAVFNFGLIGVAIGTLVAMFYRTCYFVWYLSKNIIHRNVSKFVIHLLVDFLCVLSIVIIGFLLKSPVNTYFDWLVLAIKYGLPSLGLTLLINSFFYFKDNKWLLELLVKKLKGHNRVIK